MIYISVNERHSHLCFINAAKICDQSGQTLYRITSLSLHFNTLIFNSIAA